MKPLKLTLQGFIGIYAAFGRDDLVLDLQTIPDDAHLVALVGPNGAGKSTILDNLHPYRTMPSRATTLGPGGFSYWTQIHGSTAMKELLWENGGVRYRTVLSFKTTGKTQKSDCYLYEWDTSTSAWVPVKLADGTLSDGKSTTYDLCVDAILGPPEKFFTAHFSSQGRKTIASYGAGDIKSILASVLNLQGFRELSAKAAQVGKYLRQQLEGLHAELAEARSHDMIAAEYEGRVAAVDLHLRGASFDEATALANLSKAREELAGILAKRDAQVQSADEVRFLNEQIGALAIKAATRRAGVVEQFKRQEELHRSDLAGARDALTAAQRALQLNESDVRRLNAVLTDKDIIEQAAARVPAHQESLRSIDTSVEVHQVTIAGAATLRSELNKLTAEHARLKSEGLAKVIVIEKLAETAALVEAVPCHGNDMQQTCPLMGQANAAARDVLVHKAEQVEKREAYLNVGRRLKEVQVKVDEISAIEAAVRDLQDKRKVTAATLDADNRLAARAPMIVDAETRLPVMVEGIQQQQQSIVAANNRIGQASAALDAIVLEKSVALANVDEEHTTETRLLEERLAKLEKPVTDADVESFQASVSRADAALTAVQARMRAHSEERLSHLGKLQAMRALAARMGPVQAQAEKLQEEIAKWKLLEKGLGNDGCVALSIDDSGPEIAAICNSLLSDCFDGRFIVRLDTQRQTQTGNVKETFEVKVFDGHRGTEKSLGDMSGGEEVLVNECLTRSVALYASQSSKTNCETLFTDETDGALDPEAKRTFMQMKRAVLKQGGYGREYFITHTPELWAMADYKIMVTEL